MANHSNTSNISDGSVDDGDTLDIKIAQIFVVLFFSFTGMAGSLYFSNRISAATMFLLRAFAAGLLQYIHMTTLML
jgi:hypothetical protein